MAGKTLTYTGQLRLEDTVREFPGEQCEWGSMSGTVRDLKVPMPPPDGTQ